MKKIILILFSALVFLSAQAENKKVDGESVYESKCALCHDDGKAGSPKLGDKAYWKPRFEKGIDKLFAFVLDHKQHVPCNKCSHAEVKEAIKYMAMKTDGSNRSLW